jgi:hypothetical protein
VACVCWCSCEAFLLEPIVFSAQCLRHRYRLLLLHTPLTPPGEVDSSFFSDVAWTTKIRNTPFRLKTLPRTKFTGYERYHPILPIVPTRSHNIVSRYNNLTDASIDSGGNIRVSISNRFFSRLFALSRRYSFFPLKTDVRKPLGWYDGPKLMIENY